MPKQKNSDMKARAGSRRIGFRCAGAIAPLLLAACSGDVVNLGEREVAVPPHSRCQSSTTLEGPVRVENQEQLDALEGCEVIAGDLDIVAYPGANVRSLYALVRVEGDVVVGRLATPTPIDGMPLADWSARLDAYSELIRDWLPSLEGLDHLETVDSLAVSAPVSSLQPLSGLRDIVNGSLRVSSHELETLAGVGGLRGVHSLSIEGRKLRDISALRMPETMTSLSITGPIEALSASELRIVGHMALSATMLEDLAAFENLEQADELYITENQRLRNLDALNRIGRIGDLLVQSNHELERLGEFASLVTLDSLNVQGNDNLTELSSFPAYYQTNNSVIGLDRSSINVERIEIGGNPNLRHLAMPAAWRAANFVMLHQTSLEAVDFANMQTIGSLVVTYNQVLTEVNLGALVGVGEIDVYRNRLLPLTEFDGLQFFEGRVCVRGSQCAPRP
jgi:hypothetical protein